MGRIRTIKPQIAQSETLGAVSRDARLLFILLLTVCDDHGVARAHPRILRTTLFPFDAIADKQVDAWLSELEEVGAIGRFLDEEGRPLLFVLNWDKHQVVNHKSKWFHAPVPDAAVLAARQKAIAAANKSAQSADSKHYSSTTVALPEPYRSNTGGLTESLGDGDSKDTQVIENATPQEGYSSTTVVLQEGYLMEPGTRNQEPGTRIYQNAQSLKLAVRKRRQRPKALSESQSGFSIGLSVKEVEKAEAELFESRTVQTEQPTAHARAVERLCASFRLIRGAEYGFKGGKDAKHVKDLLALVKNDVDELVRIWEKGLVSTLRGQQIHDLGQLWMKFNELRGEPAPTSWNARQKYEFERKAEAGVAETYGPEYFAQFPKLEEN